jgi:hypothetical protein
LFFIVLFYYTLACHVWPYVLSDTFFYIITHDFVSPALFISLTGFRARIIVRAQITSKLGSLGNERVARLVSSTSRALGHLGSIP